MSVFFEKAGFVIRLRYAAKLKSFFFKSWYSLFGMQIGAGTLLSKLYVTWPHQVKIGSRCKFETGIYFKFVGIHKPGPVIRIGNGVFLGTGCEFNIHKGITIGNNCLIASGSRFVDHDHGIKLGELMRIQAPVEAEIIIGDNVWIGCNVVILKGVVINSGAVVAAGAVVTQSIPADEIWGGIPARKISVRK